MATEQAWKDRAAFLENFGIIENALSNFRIHAKRVKDLKVAVLDDFCRTSDLESLLAQDPVHSVEAWTARYMTVKSTYEAIQPRMPGWPAWGDL